MTSSLGRPVPGVRTSWPCSTKLPSSQSWSMFSRAVCCFVFRRFRTASGRASSRVSAWRSSTSARSGRTASRSISVSSSPAAAATSPSSTRARTWLSQTASPTAARRSRSTPPTSERISCSIFIASMMKRIWPAAISWPWSASRLSTVPCIGARTAVSPSGMGVESTGGGSALGRFAEGAPDLPWSRTASGSTASTLTPARPRPASPALPAWHDRSSSPAAASTSSGRRSSTKRVWTLQARTSAWPSSARRKETFVSMPSALKSPSAREVRASPAPRSSVGVRPTTLASRESKRGFVW